MIAFKIFLPVSPSRRDQKSECLLCPLAEKSVFFNVIFLAVFVYALVNHVTLVIQKHLMWICYLMDQ